MSWTSRKGPFTFFILEIYESKRSFKRVLLKPIINWVKMERRIKLRRLKLLQCKVENLLRRGRRSHFNNTTHFVGWALKLFPRTAKILFINVNVYSFIFCESINPYEQNWLSYLTMALSIKVNPKCPSLVSTWTL